jgi:hypothetical protein
VDNEPGGGARRALPEPLPPPRDGGRLRDAGFTNVELVKDDELRRLYLERWPEATLTGIERIAVAGV